VSDVAWGSCIPRKTSLLWKRSRGKRKSLRPSGIDSQSLEESEDPLGGREGGKKKASRGGTHRSCGPSWERKKKKKNFGKRKEIGLELVPGRRNREKKGLRKRSSRGARIGKQRKETTPPYGTSPKKRPVSQGPARQGRKLGRSCAFPPYYLQNEEHPHKSILYCKGGRRRTFLSRQKTSLKFGMGKGGRWKEDQFVQVQ